MIRVCYVIPSLAPGGTERQLIYLIEGLVRDHEITVLCTRAAGAFAGDARRLGAYVHLLNLWGGWDPRARRRMASLFKRHRPDIVHTFLSGFDLAANRAAEITGVPVTMSSRREIADWMKRRHLRTQRKANAYVDCIVANSSAVANHVVEQEKIIADLVRVIPNGIKAEDFVSSTDIEVLRRRYKVPFHTQVIGMVANFSPVKDHALFIEIARNLLTRRPDVHFLLVGSGPLREKTQRQVSKLGIDDRFTFISSVQEMPELYRVMNCVVLTSKTEGSPNALMEAMAASRPIVAAATGGIPELVQDKVNGRLVATRNPEDFASEIEWILNHPEEANVMASRGSAHVRSNLTADAMVKAYRSLYAELLVKAMQGGR